MKLPSNKTRLDLRLEPLNDTVIMYQKWRDLLFLHWEIDPAVIQMTLPKGLYVDTFDKKAYIGITPFFLEDVRPAMLPTILKINSFREVNVRTYVFNEEGVPGVWFYSLDADQWVAVEVAKLMQLNYKHSYIDAVKGEISGSITYKVSRKNEPGYYDSYFEYKITGKEFFAIQGSLEFFLIERYLLYGETENKKLFSIQVNHTAYPLCVTEIPSYDDSLIKLDGLPATGRPPDHIVGSTGVDVKIFQPKDV
ncbi:MAG TPA: DUF2071 domain-containing protein [Ignavibacteriaceae bacterium]|nr:DUF2071 domain-containing protein [Ignavibacteriaceae bacterium]